MLPASRSHLPEQPNTSRGAILLLVPLLAVPVLLLIGSLLPGTSTWGISQWSVAPLGVLLASLALYVILMIPAVSNLLENLALSAGGYVSPLIRRIPGAIRIVITSALAFAIFFYFRSRAPVYGDGLTVVTNSTMPLLPLPSGVHEISKFLPTMLARLGYSVFSTWLRYPHDVAFGLTAALEGVVGFWGLVRLASVLFSDSYRRTVFVLGAVSSGCTLLFFGYAELYTLGTALLLWHLAYTVGFVRGKNGAIPVMASAVLLVASNFVLIPFAILASAVVIRRSNFGCTGFLVYPFGIRPLYANIAAASASVLLFWLLHVLEASFYSVTLAPFAGNQYWFLSQAHLIDMVNLVLLVAPVSLALAPALAVRFGRRGKQGADPVWSFLATAALVGFLLSFWIDPIMGAPRDWDLISIMGYPLSAFALYAVLSHNSGGNRNGAYAVRVLAFSFLLLVPNVYEKTHLKVAAARLDSLLWNDPHYQTSFDNAYRCISWGGLLVDQLGQPELAEKYFVRRLSVDYACDICAYDLGKIYLRKGMNDSAGAYLGRAAALTPDKPKFVAAYAQALQNLGDTARASLLISNIGSLDSLDAETEQTLATVSFQLGRYNDAKEYLRRCMSSDPSRWESPANLGLTFVRTDENDSAAVYFRKALKAAPRETKPQLYALLIKSQVAVKDRQAARQSLQDYLREFPGARDAGELNNLIGASERKP